MSVIGINIKLISYKDAAETLKINQIGIKIKIKGSNFLVLTFSVISPLNNPVKISKANFHHSSAEPFGKTKGTIMLKELIKPIIDKTITADNPSENKTPAFFDVFISEVICVESD